MKKEELADCPICGDRCFAPDKSDWIKGDVVQCTNVDPGCEYAIEANTFEEAIALHNRLAGKCRWARHTEGYTYFTSSCVSGKRIAYTYKHTYCSNCGKQIEEVKK